MVVSGSDKRMWENRVFLSHCSMPNYKRRKVSARRDFPKGLVQFAAASNHVAEPEELEAIASANPVVFYQVASANSNRVEKVENEEESDYDPEELEGVESDDESPVTKDDVCSEPISELPEILYARHDYPVVFYHVARKICAWRDYPVAFYANSSHVVRVEREESESDPEEIEAIDSDDDDLDAKVDKTESKCEPICSVDKMEPEMQKGMQDEKSANQIVGSTEPLDSTRMRGTRTTEPLDSNRTRGTEGKRGDYLQFLLAYLDHMAATLLQMNQEGAFKNKSAV